MAISASNLTANYSDTDATSYETASISPTTSRLLLLAVESLTDISATPTIPTATGCGLTWQQVATVAYDTGSTQRGRLTILRAMGSPSSGAVTISFGQTQASCVWSIDEFADVATDCTNGVRAVVQSSTGESSGTDAPSVSLLSFGDATNNATYGAFSKQGNPSGFTQGGGFTLLGNATSTTPRTRLSTEWKLGEDTVVDGSTSGNTSPGGCIAIEIAASNPSYSDALPSRLAASSGTTVYISQGGNDTTGDGTLGNPWKTLSKAFSEIVAGDVVALLDTGGTFNEDITSSKAGSAGNTITVCAASGHSPVWGGLLHLTGQYVRVGTGIHFDASTYRSAEPVWFAASNQEIVGCHVSGSADGGIFVGGGTGTTVVDNVQIWDCLLNNNGSATEGQHTDLTLCHGVYVAAASNAIVANCISHANGGFGFQVGPNADGTIIVHCNGTANGKSGVTVWGDGSNATDNALVINSIFVDNTEYAVSTYWGGSTGTGNVCRNCLSYGNGLGDFTGTGITYSTNVIADPEMTNVNTLPDGQRISQTSIAVGYARGTHTPLSDYAGSFRPSCAAIGALSIALPVPSIYVTVGSSQRV